MKVTLFLSCLVVVVAATWADGGHQVLIPWVYIHDGGAPQFYGLHPHRYGPNMIYSYRPRPEFWGPGLLNLNREFRGLDDEDGHHIMPNFRPIPHLPRQPRPERILAPLLDLEHAE